MENQTPHQLGSEIDKDSRVSKHLMIPLSPTEYQRLFGEQPEGDNTFIGLWVTSSDLRRGESRWRSLGEPDPMEHDDTLQVLRGCLKDNEGYRQEYTKCSDQLDDMCKQFTEAEARIETLQAEKAAADKAKIEAQRSTALHESRVNAKAQTIETLREDKADLNRHLNAERVKVNAYERGKRKRNLVQKAVAKIFMIS